MAVLLVLVLSSRALVSGGNVATPSIPTEVTGHNQPPKYHAPRLPIRTGARSTIPRWDRGHLRGVERAVRSCGLDLGWWRVHEHGVEPLCPGVSLSSCHRGAHDCRSRILTAEVSRQAFHWGRHVVFVRILRLLGLMVIVSVDGGYVPLLETPRVLTRESTEAHDREVFSNMSSDRLSKTTSFPLDRSQESSTRSSPPAMTEHATCVIQSSK